MIKRIKQLWEDNDTIEVCYPEQGSPVSVSATTLEKFAQLIVQECKDLLFESSENNRLPIAVDDMVHIIDTHFGVEE